jgi:hypothetical protein
MKSQVPSSKFQRNFKRQAPIASVDDFAEVRELEFLWNLEFGIWNF